MKFKLQNIGIIKDYELELGNLTIICGKNNTGKTYLSYSVYGYIDKLFYVALSGNFKSFNTVDFIKNIQERDYYLVDIRKLETELELLCQNYCNKYQKNLHEIFNSNSDDFNNSIFSIEFKKLKNIKDIEFSHKTDFGKIEKQKGTENIKLTINKDSEYLTDPQPFNDFFNVKNGDRDSQFTHEDVFYKLSFGSLSVAIIRIMFQQIIASVFLISSERSFLQTIQKEIDQYKAILLQEFQKNKNINISEIGKSRFSYPVEKQLNFIRNFDKTIKEKSFVAEKHPEIIEYIENMFGVKYEYVNDQLMINVGNKLLPQYMVSSSIRSLADLHIWLKHKASKGDLLMIDEPELNLHPENQIKLARLFSKLINIGINVWITTHSDYIVKEINNLLLLSNDFSERENLLTQFGYSKNEILTKDQVKVYISRENGELHNVEINKHGMSSTTFDETIERINEVSNSIFNLID